MAIDDPLEAAEVLVASGERQRSVVAERLVELVNLVLGLGGVLAPVGVVTKTVEACPTEHRPASPRVTDGGYTDRAGRTRSTVRACAARGRLRPPGWPFLRPETLAGPRLTTDC